MPRQFFCAVSPRLEQCSSAPLVIVLARKHQRRRSVGFYMINGRARHEQCVSAQIMTVL